MTNIQEQIQNLEIRIDGELVTPPEPSITERTVSNVQAAITGFTGNVALQTQMFVYDALHGTNYRDIRNTLVAENRNAEFEKKIGLVATKRG
jgi:hypothetical protein